MKAIFLVRYGSSRGAFEIRDVPEPVAGPGEVVIRVKASGLNYADVMARRGLYKAAPPNPAILGYDVAGEIHSIGPGVTRFLPGDRVAAMTRFGGYAGYARTQADACIIIPAGMEPALATSLATQASTAVYCSSFATRLYRGDRVLIHAAAGGVGTFLIQLAKAAGCTVFASASPHKFDYLRESGADYVLDSRGAPLAEASAQTVDGRLDVIFDNIGGRSFKQGLALLAHGGRIVAYGAAAQNRGDRSGGLSSARVGLGFGFHSPIGLISQSKSILGVNMLAIADHRPAILAEVMSEVDRLLDAGILKPALGKAFPAELIDDAHDYLESRQSVGKVAITW